MSSIRARKREIQAIVSVFETGRAAGDYSAVALLEDGAGVSYGAHQATDRSGALDRIVARYLERGGQVHELEDFADELKSNATASVDPRKPPRWVRRLMELLRLAGQDPVMHEAQEHVFDTEYWAPALGICADLGLVLPLSGAVVYDTCIHSGPSGLDRIRRRFPEVPPAKGGEERAWSRAYVLARRAWLAGYHLEAVRRTTYRMDALEALMQWGRWDLTPPFEVRGQVVG